jgi:hypothetical protein
VTKWLYEFLFVSEAGWWVGGICIYLGAAALVWLLLSRDLRMGPDPVMPLSEATTVELVIRTVPAEPNWTPVAEFFPYLEEFAADVDRVTEAVIDITTTVEIKAVVDPLAVTAEVERVDPGSPLFYELRRPKPFEPDSFTVGWNRARIAEIIEAGRPQ